MKNSSIIEILDSIDKKDLIVTIPTKNYKVSEKRISIIDKAGNYISFDLSLETVAFGNNKNPEFAIKNKKVAFRNFHTKDGKIEVDQDQKLLIENFFQNFIIADISYKAPERKINPTRKANQIRL